MNNFKRAIMAVTFVFVLFGLIGCDKTDEIDVSNIESVTVNFETNSDSVIDTIVINQQLIDSIDEEAIKNVTLEDLAFLVPTKDGFVFENWYFDQALTQPLDVDSPIIDEYLEILKLESLEIDITLYAKWVPVTVESYTVTYELNGGVNNSSNPVTFSSDESVTLLNPTKDGYTFLGWYDNPSFNNSMITTIESNTSSNVTLYAKWQMDDVVVDDKDYTVTYHLDKGTNANENITLFNSTDDDFFLIDAIKDGFTFMGWYSDEDFVNVVTTIDTSTTSNIDLYAKWGDASMFTFQLRGDVYYIKHGDVNLSGVVVIPDNFNGKPVVGIGEDAFSLNVNITEVILPESITVIEQTAFNNCEGLEKINIENVVTIGYGAFEQCDSLTRIVIGDLVTTIESFTFNGCDNLKTIVLGENVTLIERQAFSFTGVTSFVLNDNLTTIEESALFSSKSLTSIYIPVSVVSIGNYVFTGCDDLTIYAGASSQPSGWLSNWNKDKLPVIYGQSVDDIPDEADSYNIVYHLDGGTNDIDNPGSYTVDDVTLKDPVKVGYVFEGWFLDTNLTIELTMILASTKTDVTLYAKWTEDTAPSYLNYQEYDDYVVITGLNEDLASIEIPSSYNGKPVTVIGEFAFVYKNTITSVILPDTITTIEAQAFAGCYRLTSINFPASLTSIGEAAFSSTAFTELVLPDTITYFGAHAFSNNDKLVTVTLPNNMTLIPAHMFSESSSLTSINIPTTVVEIEEYAFAGCLVLPSIDLINVRIIGKSAFGNCMAITTLILSDEVTSIEDSAFAGMSSLTSVTLPENLEIISSGAFTSCRNLTTIDLPDTLTYIGENAFAGCGLTEINLPDSLIFIGKSAFKSNDFTTLYIPENVEVIDEVAFWKCDSLSSVYLPSTVELVNGRAFKETGYDVKIYINADSVPETWDTTWRDSYRGSVELVDSFSSITISYELDDGVNSEFNYSTKTLTETIELQSPTKSGYNFIGWYSDSSFNDEITEIEKGGTSDITVYALWEAQLDTQYSITYVLDGGSNLSTTPQHFNSTDTTELVNPTKLGYKFNGWYTDASLTTAIERIDAGTENDVTLYASFEMEYLIFEEYEDHVEVIGLRIPMILLIIPGEYNSKPVTIIADSAFYNREVILDVILPDTITEIQINAFESCENLRSINLPDGLLTIGDSAFGLCHALEEITIPSSVINIAEGVFKYCYKLHTVTFNSELTVIPPRMFYECHSLVNIVLPDTVEEIGSDAFRACINLESVTLPDGLLVIQRYAFKYTPKLTSIIIPETVQTIGDEAFTESGLTSIDIPDSVTYLGTGAFNFCDDLVSVTIGSGLASEITYQDFSNVESLTTFVINPANTLYHMSGDALIMEGDETTLVKYIGDDSGSYTIPMGVNIIGRSAFEGSNLTEILLPNSVTMIDYFAFENSNNLDSILIPSSVVTIERNAFDTDESIVIYVASSSLPTGWDDSWTSDNNIVYFGVIGSNIGVYNDIIAYIIVNDHVEITGIDDSDGSVSIVIPSVIDSYPVTVIKAYAISSNALGSIIIPATITTVEENAFNSWNLDIYCEAETIPSGWDNKWDNSRADVVWNVIWFTFDSQGGSTMFPIVSTRDNLKSLGRGWEPVRDGYVFAGWYTDILCTDGNEFVFPQAPAAAAVMPSLNATIYAKWIPEEVD